MRVRSCECQTLAIAGICRVWDQNALVGPPSFLPWEPKTGMREGKVYQGE